MTLQKDTYGHTREQPDKYNFYRSSAKEPTACLLRLIFLFAAEGYVHHWVDEATKTYLQIIIQIGEWDVYYVHL